jgi:hypothetical protein
MKFYHIDRSNNLKEGQLIKLEPVFIPKAPEAANDLAVSMYRNGVSRHGLKYIREVSKNSHTEWFFEYVRRSTFPNKPSRFESFFAFDSLESVEQFKVKFHATQSPVFEVECDDFFKGDMNLLGSQNSPLIYSLFANTYWSGKTLPELGIEPLWEYLLTGNISIGNRFNIEEKAPTN